MQLNISGHHLDITDSIRDYVTTKLARLEKHYDRITSTTVILSVDKLIQKAEATVHVSGGDIFADAQSEDLYAANDSLADKPAGQIVQHKEKHRDHGFNIMKIQDLLSPEHARADISGVSKKRILEFLSSFFCAGAPDQTAADAIYQKLLERERLGSTG